MNLYRQEGAVKIELNRPERLNALNEPLAEDLLAALEDIRDDSTARAVLLTGAGRGFCSGADIDRPRGDDPGAATGLILRDFVNPIVLTMRRLPQPVVAALNGVVAGVGCGFAAAADILLAAESAYFLLAFSRVGLAPDGGSSMTIAARIGLGRAASLAMLPERLHAAQAHTWGLVDRLLPDAELGAESTALVLQLAAGPTRSFAAIKEELNASMLPDLEAQLALEADHQAALANSHDHAEGVAALKEHRTPHFQGFQR